MQPSNTVNKTTEAPLPVAGDRTLERCSTVDEAMRSLGRLVTEQRGGDEAYFASQADRFRFSTDRIHSICAKPCRILDIGSHYLHQSALLSLLGHEVFAVDVPLFTTANFVVERSRRVGITNVTVDSLEEGNFLTGSQYEGTFDVVIFTAILEHITFNPARFWRRVYELMNDRGCIYLTTPNALRPGAFLRHLRRLLTFQGVGITVPEIWDTVTYGHHWKEYSSREIKEYFRILSPDFAVESRYYFGEMPRRGVRGTMARIAGVLPMFRPEIEAIVSLSGKTNTLVRVPELPMATASHS